MEDSKIPLEYRIAKTCADNVLKIHGHNPSEVYEFITKLMEVEEIDNVRFGDLAQGPVYGTWEVVFADYTGDKFWGGGRDKMGKPKKEFEETCRTLFESISKQTGYDLAVNYSFAHARSNQLKHQYGGADFRLPSSKIYLRIKKLDTE